MIHGRLKDDRERARHGAEKLPPAQWVRRSLPAFRDADFNPPPTREEWDWVLENGRLLVKMSLGNRIAIELIEEGDYLDMVIALAPFVVSCLRSWRQDMGMTHASWVSAYLWSAWQNIGIRAKFFYLRWGAKPIPRQPYLAGDYMLEPSASEEEEDATPDEIPKLMAAFERLKNNHREVLRRRFGLDTHEKETLLAISEDWGVSKERVRQIEANALRDLREKFEGEIADRKESPQVNVPKSTGALKSLIYKCGLEMPAELNKPSKPRQPRPPAGKRLRVPAPTYQPFTFVA